MSMIDVIRKEMMTAMKIRTKREKKSFYVIKCIKKTHRSIREKI